ncbi:MAG: GNAT family N-acetyltransferase [Candidatus Thorarchaeota archaeon]|nr:GNAT family N-acetyltransferase [Candidatus Thorarchaeota archaeon]
MHGNQGSRNAMYTGKKVRLRALEMDDLDSVMEHWNTYETRRFLYSAVPMSQGTEKEWLEKASKSRPWKDGELNLAIEDKKTAEFLGTVSLMDVSKQHSRAEFGIAIHNPENQGKGYGTDATRVMLWIGFHVLNLNSIFLLTLAHNKRAIRAYEKAGFKKCGTFRKAAYTEGEFHDFVAMDVLKEDFMGEYPLGTHIEE